MSAEKNKIENKIMIEKQNAIREYYENKWRTVQSPIPESPGPTYKQSNYSKDSELANAEKEGRRLINRKDNKC